MLLRDPSVYPEKSKNEISHPRSQQGHFSLFYKTSQIFSLTVTTKGNSKFK